MGNDTRPPNYEVPWIDGVTTARQIQLLILLTDLKPKMLRVRRSHKLERTASRTIFAVLFVPNSVPKVVGPDFWIFKIRMACLMPLSKLEAPARAAVLDLGET